MHWNAFEHILITGLIFAKIFQSVTLGDINSSSVDTFRMQMLSGRVKIARYRGEGRGVTSTADGPRAIGDKTADPVRTQTDIPHNNAKIMTTLRARVNSPRLVIVGFVSRMYMRIFYTGACDTYRARCVAIRDTRNCLGLLFFFFFKFEIDRQNVTRPRQ